MARPAIIIGVGGTGQWVLTHLKKDLLEIGHGKMPEGVKLLCFDTVKHPQAVAGDERQKDKTEKGEVREKKVGAVQLENKTEYIHIGSDLSSLVKQINRGELPHLNWLNGNKTLENLPQAVLNCDDGAGAIRQLGRLCLVNDVQSIAASKILANISAAMRSINAAEVTVDNRLEIIIVGSLAGGTGSGTFIDVALLCRSQAPAAFSGNIIVSGFIVTPRQFTAAGGASADRKMLAASFAAWRELDRFLVSNDQYGSNRVQYSAVDNRMMVTSGTRLFDFTYIIDPQRSQNTLPAAQAEKGGLFASIADSISQILDDNAGADYSARIVNLGKTYLDHAGVVLHSTIGAYTIKTPVYYEQATMTQKLAQHSLKDFLAPQMAAGLKVQHLLDNQNGEVGPQEVGQGGALTFLKNNTKPFGGQNLTNAPLCQLVGVVWSNKLRESKEAKTKDAMSHMPQHMAAMNVSNLLKGQWDHTLMNDVVLSRAVGRDPYQESEKQRIQNEIQKSRLMHIGNIERDSDSHGELGKALTLCQIEQERLFGYFLRAYSEEILNGTSPNVVTARSGKLGYLIGLYKGIKDGFDYYLGYLDDLIEIRATEMNKLGRARAGVENAWKNFVNNPNKKSIFAPGGIHPDSFLTQEKFVEAERTYDDVLKERILIEALQRTVLEMQKILLGALADLNLWKDQLVGLYNRVVDEEDNIKANQASDDTQSAVRKIVSQKVLTNNEVNNKELLETIHWKANLATFQETLSDNSTVERIRGIDFDLFAEKKDEKWEFTKDTREESIDSNFKNWETLAGKPFEDLLAENPPTPIASVLMHTPETDTGKELAVLLDRKAEPFYAPTNGGMGPRHDPPRSGMIRVYQTGDSKKYFDDTLQELTSLDATLKNSVKLSNSADQFKLTYIRYDDCITSRDFEIWQICRDAYLEFAVNPGSTVKPEDLHTFPTEINACKYEMKIMNELRRGYRILDARVVALLENNERLELFFRALALGLVQKEIDTFSQRTYWYYQIPGSEKIYLTKVEGEVGVAQETNYFHLINQFCIKAKDIRPEYGGHYAYVIDFENLKNAFYNKLREMGSADEFKQFCQDQIERGVVADLRGKVNYMRSQAMSELQKKSIAVAEEDLADLIETIYRFAIREGR